MNHSQDIKIFLYCKMEITLVFIIIIIVWFAIRRYQHHQFVDSIKHKQKQEVETLYTKFETRFSNSGEGTLPNNTDCIYCIYSDKRKQHIKDTFNQLGLDVTYFKGIFPDDITDKEYDTLSCTNTKEGTCTIANKKSRLPVQLSFVMCMMNAIKNGYKNIIIFEDDIDVQVDRDTLEKSLGEFYNSSYDMFYMGYCLMSCLQSFDKNKHKYIAEVPNKKLLCHHAIAMKTNVFHELLEFLFPMIIQKDHAFKAYFKHYDRSVCVPKKSYFNQRRDLFKTENGSTSFNHKTCNLE